MPTDNNAAFWNAALGADRNLARLNRDIAKDKGLERKAIDACTKMPKFYPEYNSHVRIDLQPWADSLLATAGLPCDSIATRLYVVDNPRAEAFAPLIEDGFAIVITTGLVYSRGCDDDMLNGIISAQAVHGAMRHQLQFFYDEAKRRRKGKVWSGIAIGALVAADLTLAMTESDHLRRLLIQRLLDHQYQRRDKRLYTDAGLHLLGRPDIPGRSLGLPHDGAAGQRRQLHQGAETALSSGCRCGNGQRIVAMHLRPDKIH